MNGYNTFNYGYQGGPAMGGYFYQEPQKLQMTQPLTQEELKSLRKTSGFSLDISQDELLRSYCTHRTADKIMVTEDDEGNYTCALCGTKFPPFNGTVDEARDITEKFRGLMETTKLIGLTLPPQLIKEVMQIEPIVTRIPALYEQCLNEYKRATGTVGGYAYDQSNNAFAMYQTMINPMAGNGYYDPAMQQPMYGAQPVYGAQPTYAQPMQQPMMQPGYGQPMYNQPMQPMMQPMMQQPQGNPFNVNNAPVTNTAPAAAPASNDQVTVTKTLTD